MTPKFSPVDSTGGKMMVQETRFSTKQKKGQFGPLLAFCVLVGVSAPATAVDIPYQLKNFINLGVMPNADMAPGGKVLAVDENLSQSRIFPNGSTTPVTIGTNPVGQSFSGKALNDIMQMTGGVPAFGGWSYMAAVKNADGTIQTLGSLGPGGGSRASYGMDINNAGQVTGWAYTGLPGGPNHAFIWDGSVSPTMRDLGVLPVLPGEIGSSYGVAINNLGQVVGTSSSGYQTLFHAFVSAPNGGALQDLGALGGDEFNSWGTGINDQGQVIGVSVVTYSGPYGRTIQHGFLYDSSFGMRDLGVLGTSRGWNTSTAQAVNSFGQVVGASSTSTGDPLAHAFITGDDGVGMYDLNDIFDLPGEEYFVEAWGINDAGQVLVETNMNHYYVLSLEAKFPGSGVNNLPPAAVPEPAETALLLSGLMVLVSVSRRRA